MSFRHLKVIYFQKALDKMNSYQDILQHSVLGFKSRQSAKKKKNNKFSKTWSRA